MSVPVSAAAAIVSLPCAHDEPYGAYFERLAAHPDALAAQRRLLTHLEADLDGDERVALWRALWTLHRRLDPAQRAQVAASLDGRHARRLAALDLPWDAPALIENLAATTQPAAAQALFVPALLAHHGDDPLARPDAARWGRHPRLVLLAVRAALWAPAAPLDGDALTRLQQAVMSAAAADAGGLPLALALLFELALHAGDGASAASALADLVHHGQTHWLRPERVCAWLDGSAFAARAGETLPLQLLPRWQRVWLQPAHWHQPARLAALMQAVQRPAVRERLGWLQARLQALADEGPPAAASASDNADAGNVPVLKVLRALDGAYQLLAQGGELGKALPLLVGAGVLAPPALAALYRGQARGLDPQAAGSDRDEALLLALLQARQHDADDTLRAQIAGRLPALGAAPLQLGPDWRDEEPYWAALMREGSAPEQRLAAFQLASLWSTGSLEPRPPRRCQRLHQAAALWQRLAGHPLYEAVARRALQQPEHTLLRPLLRAEAGVEHLWVETPGAHGVTIVFACVASHHSYPEVALLRGRLPGQHLLFVNCPEKNWYSDAAYERVHHLLQATVLQRFAHADVTCWYGSMGGHGALKFALAFGLRAIVFNPQTDLDLWAAFRPRERPLLWAAKQHAGLAEWPLGAWEAAPVYYACGAATADREALAWVLERWRRCQRLSVIVEKFDDPDHAGLMERICGGRVAPALTRITQRLQQLHGGTPLPGMQAVHADGVAAFWQQLDDCKAGKLEIQVRDGRVWWQASEACGTTKAAVAAAGPGPV
ncbi:hypothetical protein [Pseudorhodoferax sp.]|uniref:hypothetical protein n=1 Tax=Pseudorhodoferax sp. TaxID=1993553 RepID=UPI002DD662D7|nr:hypothetical protein [Pseudorhodoferax sp.]